MKVVVNKIIPFGGFKLFLFMFWLFCHKYPNDVDYNHENIHYVDSIEMLFLFFWLWYGIEYLVRVFQYKFDFHKAYKNISFEREAYINEKNMEYIENRTMFSWFTYLSNDYEI